MKREGLVLLALVAGGCLPPARIDRLRDELAAHARRGDTASALHDESRMLDLASRYYGEGAVETTKLRSTLAEDYAQWGWNEHAREMAAGTLAGVEGSRGEEGEALVLPLLGLARVRILERDWEEAEATADRLSALCRRVYEREVAGSGLHGDCRSYARFELDDLYRAVGNPYKAAEARLLADGLEDGIEDPRFGMLELASLGRLYASFGAYPEARWYLERCVEASKPFYPDRRSRPEERHRPSGEVELLVVDSAHSFPSQAPLCVEDLVDLDRRLGRNAEAHAVDVWQRELWSRGPEVEESLKRRIRDAESTERDAYTISHFTNSLAYYYARKGRTPEAVTAYRKAVELVDRGFARDGVYGYPYPAALVVDELLGLGSALEGLSRPDEAAAAYARAATIATRWLHPRHLWRLEAMAGEARALATSAAGGGAVAAWRRYLDVASAIRGRDHADYARGLHGLADAFAIAGRSRESVATRSEAKALSTRYQAKVDAVRDLPLPASLLWPSPRAN